MLDAIPKQSEKFSAAELGQVSFGSNGAGHVGLELDAGAGCSAPFVSPGLRPPPCPHFAEHPASASEGLVRRSLVESVLGFDRQWFTAAGCSKSRNPL